MSAARRSRRLTHALLALWLATLGLAHADGDRLAAVPTLPHTIEQRVPQDPTLFTQGLAFSGDLLLASGGGYRESRLVLRRLADAQPVRTRALPPEWFAEGIAPLGDRVFVLTWREGTAQSFSLPALEPGPRFAYQGEGWGLTSDGASLIQSDGSHVLRWRDPENFAPTRALEVLAGERPLTQLNELEWVNGWILANVWLSDYVVGIDPHSGCVAWKLALGGLLDARERRRADVLNGVAWDARDGRLWVTGKRWPWLFGLRVELPPAPAARALTAERCPG